MKRLQTRSAALLVASPSTLSPSPLKLRRSLWSAVSVAIPVLVLTPFTAQAALYTWTGGSSVWELSSNWTTSPATGLYPNSYTDTTTIGVSAGNPVSLSTTALLGGSSTSLTIGNYSPNNAVALDITPTGTLGMQGGVSISSSTTNAKQIKVEGTLRNDGPAATSYSIGGGTSANDYVSLSGGTISSLNGGIWAFARPVNGYGTISSPFTNTSTISANVSGQTLHVTGSSTAGGTLTSGVSGAILSLESSLTGITINHTGEVDFNGATLSGVTLANSGSGAFNVTGNSTLTGTITRNTNTPFTLTGSNTLSLSGATFSNVSGGSASIAVGTGTLNNPGSTASTISNGDPITLAGGQITNTGGGTFTINTQITGRGTIYGPVTSGNSIKGIGGIMYVDGTSGTVDVHGTTVFTDGVAGSVADLKGNINFGTGGFLYSNPSGNTGNGEVRLDGATLNGTINSNALGQGAVNVVANSTLNGTYTSSATLGINSGKQFTVSGSTLHVNVGSLTNNGTLAIGNGTLNNITANAYSLGGGGSITLAGGSITSTGGGAFTSNNTLSGYGNVTALYTNNGQVIANGNGIEQTLNMQAITPVTNTGGMGWYAQNHGKLTLPSITVNSPTTYNWGGSQMVNSIAMTFSGINNSGNLAVSLLSADRADVPAGLVNPIGVWSFNSGTLAFDSASMAFSYDAAFATSLGVNPSDLGLLGYNGANWVIIPTTIDTTNMTLTTSPEVPSFYHDFAIAKVPEPATLLMGISAAGLFLRRKRAPRQG